MTSIPVTVGIGIGFLFAGLLGGYVIAEQTYSPKNLMVDDPQTTTQWMSTMMGTMMNDQNLRNEMMDMMMQNPQMMQDMMQNQQMMNTMINDNSKLIHMGMNMFMPNELYVKPNTAVTWQTHDMEVHNVYGIFKTDSGKNITILSEDIPHMEKWSFTFEEPGIFEFACGYHEHEGMEGKLIVA